jgi:hypothetical protein
LFQKRLRRNLPPEFSTMNISRTTAIHEAAHAVAAIRAGLIFDHVTALPDDAEETDGALHWTDLQSSGDLELSPRLLAIVSLAGPFAEAKEVGRRLDRVFAGYAAADDREAVAQLGLDDAQFVAASRETMELIERDWPLIERIADQLMAGGLLEFDEVEALVIETGD